MGLHLVFIFEILIYLHLYLISYDITNVIFPYSHVWKLELTTKIKGIKEQYIYITRGTCNLNIDQVHLKVIHATR
jgi:hypothetical protein